MNNENLLSPEDVKVNSDIETILSILEPYSRKDQNKIILGVFGHVLKERRNIIKSKKDEIEEVDKDTEDLRTEIVNVNSKIVQNERTSSN